LHTQDSPPPGKGRGRTRRLVLAAAATALAVTGSLQVRSLAAADDSDSGPVGTSANVTGLLEKLTGSDILTNKSSLKAKDGRTYWLKNHVNPSLLSPAALGKLGSVPGLDITKLKSTGLLGKDSGGTVAQDGVRRKYLIVWAGDNNVLDKSGAELTALPKSVGPDLIGQKDLIGPDFFAVIDATAGSSSYGKVVNTATVGPLVENEPHHMQYVWHKGNSIFAGGLFTDVTYVLDASKLPALSLKGVNLPTDTLCGSVPDAYWVTKDGSAYGTYMGGPDVPGPCTYTDGQVRFGNGFAGSPGEVVRLDKNGKTVDESPATPSSAENEQRCDNIPQLSAPTCANPHGIQAREDLNTLVTSDYNEPRNIILNPVQAPSSYLRRPTVRTWDIADKDHPKLKSVSFLPDGPRVGRVAHQEEPRAAMETTVTNQPGHKGAFAETMQGGAIYYTPDITVTKPKWREVFDLTTSNKQVDPGSDYYGGGSNGGWVQTSHDDRYLYHAVTGRGASGTNGASPSYILKLDISKLIASGDTPECNIDSVDEITAGGQESDCPAVASTIKAPGGPHWGALDNLELGGDGYYHEGNAKRLAYSNYFVARTGLNGDHRVCLVDEESDGALKLDEKFRDENSGTPCVEFNRDSWPHGDWGPAKPHSMLFVTADDDIK
jgi:hypothetical protein